MAERGDEPDGGGGEPEDGKVLSPEELDITDSKHVTELDDGRYVVSSDQRFDAQPRTESAAEPRSQADGPPDTDPGDGVHAEPDPDPTPETEPETEATPTDTDHDRDRPENTGRDGPTGAGTGDTPTRDDRPQQLTRTQVHDWLAESFQEGSAQYGFDVTASFDGEIRQRRMASNDLVTIFESLILWYAQQVDTDTPVEEVLGILLAEANAPVRYPPESLHQLVRRSGLEPEDSIADLLRAVEDDGARL